MRNMLQSAMIVSIRHKGLRNLFTSGHVGGIQPHHAQRLRLQLSALHTAQELTDMDIPGWRLHPLKGRQKGRWAIAVDKNWRLTFEFQDHNVYLLDYEDYH